MQHIFPRNNKEQNEMQTKSNGWRIGIEWQRQLRPAMPWHHEVASLHSELAQNYSFLKPFLPPFDAEREKKTHLITIFTYILVIGCITVRGGGKGHRSGGDWWPPWLECLAHQTWSSFLLFLSFCRTHRVPTYPWYSSSPPPSPSPSPRPVCNYYYKCLIYHIQASGSPQPIHFLKAHDAS